MTSEGDGAHNQMVDRLVQAFREQLENYPLDQKTRLDRSKSVASSTLDSQSSSSWRSSSRTRSSVKEPSTPTRGVASTNSGNTSSLRSRVNTKAHFGNEENNGVDDGGAPEPVQTPYTGRSGATVGFSPPLSQGKTLGTEPTSPYEKPDTPHSNDGNPTDDDSPPALTDEENNDIQHALTTVEWRSHVNMLVRHLEAQDTRIATLERERKHQDEDLQDRLAQLAALKAQELLPLERENVELRQIVHELRRDAVGQHKQQLEALRNQIERERQEWNRERVSLETLLQQQQDRVDKLQLQVKQEKEQQELLRQHQKERNSYSFRSGAVLDRDEYHSERALTSTVDSLQSTRGPPPTSSRYHLSPGQQLVRDVAEVTHMDTDYLAPLSDILDRRLKRAPGSTNGTNGSRYSSMSSGERYG